MQTVKYNIKEGVKVILSVFITDVFFISISFILLSQVLISDTFSGLIRIIGSIYLAYLAYRYFNFSPINIDQIHQEKPKSFTKGMIYLFLSPGSYIFWFTIGGPIIFQAYQTSIYLVFSFLLGLYIAYIGSNVFIAITAHKSKDLFKSERYNFILKFLGILLIGYAIFFLIEGLRLLSVI